MSASCRPTPIGKTPGSAWATCACSASEFRGSIEAFENCLRKRNPWPEAQVNLGLAYWKMGDRDWATAVPP